MQGDNPESALAGQYHGSDVLDDDAHKDVLLKEEDVRGVHVGYGLLRVCCAADYIARRAGAARDLGFQSRRLRSGREQKAMG